MVLLLLLAGCGKPSVDNMPQLTALDRQLSAEDFDKGIPAAQAYVKRYPRSFKGQTILGWMYLKSNQLEPARECFDKALELDPKWDNAYVGLGVLHRKNGELQKARESYQKAIEIVPENAEAYSSLMVIELMESNDQKAVELGEKAWALRKDLASIPANLVIAYHLLGNNAKRDEMYQHAARLKYPSLRKLDDIISGKVAFR
jgi:Tfp pilus assembly protein PilF